jgi:hypothetical protein
MVYYKFLFHFSYGRDYADPYLGHGIGPVAGYGVSNISQNLIFILKYFSIFFKKKKIMLRIGLQAAVYRSGYNRFAPY